MREIILDTETTGLDPKSGHRIIEIGCVEIFNKLKTGNHFHFHINPERDVPQEAFKIHGISTEFLRDKPLFKDIVSDFIDFIADSKLVIHNAPFDIKFLNAELAMVKHNLITMDRVIDTLVIARRKFPGAPASLDALCRKFNINNDHREKHGALLDSELLYDIYIALTEGVQSELNLQQKQIARDGNKPEQAQKPSVPYRQFAVSEQEEQAHKDFLTRIKKPMWEEN